MCFESSKLVCLQLWRERESKGRGWVKSPSRKVSWTKKLFGLVRSLGRSRTGLASKPQAGTSPFPSFETWEADSEVLEWVKFLAT